MTHNNPPTIIINRLLVSRKGKTVYDENFHHGVNIIRGSNSSGKSTIADFIFFVLGGDVTKWKPEAEGCDFVLAEIDINHAILTLKRPVASTSRQSLSIFWGDLEASLKSNIEGWQIFPYQRSSKKESFSQVLFRVLRFPEVRGDASNNITMHQLFRLIYIDQLSNSLSLFRDEMFDSPLTRKTIGDLLLGVYDDALYSEELELKEATKKIESVKDQLNNLVLILRETEHEIDLKTITQKIIDTEEQLNKVRESLSNYDSINSIKPDSDISISEEIEKIRNKYVNLQEQLSDLKNFAHYLQFDIQDSLEFLKSLEARGKALGEALIARETLGQMKITHCPLCLNLIRETTDGSVCQLCKSQITAESQQTRFHRLKQELLFQIKESKSLLIPKEDNYAQITRNIPGLAEQVDMAKVRLEEELKRVRTTRNRRIDDLLIKSGQLESDLITLHKQAKALSILENLKKTESDLHSLILNLNVSIKAKKEKQTHRLARALEMIEQFATDFLRSDLPREEIFKHPGHITVDFEKNVFAVNARNVFSASSTVYLKNCIHYAIFFASLDLDFLRYPRFILCDNMEDKGMEEIRSHNFQRKVVEVANKYTKPYQIIFTTSMIEPGLDNSMLCVGDKYSEENKSLKIH